MPRAAGCSVLLEHEPVAGRRRKATGSAPSSSATAGPGDERTLTAPYFLDATELGDLLPMAGVEFVTGAESQAGTGEPHAAELGPARQPAGDHLLLRVDYREGEDHTIDRPAEYAFWRDYVPALTPAWPGRLLDLTLLDPLTLKPVSRGFDPRGAGAGPLGLPADPRPPQLPARRLSRQLGDHAGQLAAERLLARP